MIFASRTKKPCYSRSTDGRGRGYVAAQFPFLRVLSLLAGFGVAACGQRPDLPQDPILPSQSQSKTIADRGTGTPRQDLITVFYRPRAGAPSLETRRSLTAGTGAVYHSRYHGDLPAAISIPRDRLAGLTSLSWMQVVEIDTAPPDFPAATWSSGASFLELSTANSSSQSVPWGVENIGAAEVHAAFNLRGEGIKVAVLDEGVQYSHPDLTPIAGCFDTFGAGGAGCVYGSEDHGTGVSGIIAARNNTFGVIGVAPAASLYSARVCYFDCPQANVYDGFVWAMNVAQADVINISIGSCGGDVSSTMQDAITSAVSQGKTVVAAAGNGAFSSYGCHAYGPVARYARASGTIGVSAYGTNLLFKPDYQYGPEVDFAGPTDVVTTRNAGTYALFGGTSAASPHVAGAVALMRQAGFPPSLILARLAETAFQVPGHSYPNIYYGHGHLRLASAIVQKPGVGSITWCTGTAITSPGTCEISASVFNGIQPLQVRFEVTRSDISGTVVYDWGPATREIQVGAGDYSLAIKAIPREQVYLRTGYHAIQEIPVCTSGSQLLASIDDSPTTNATGGCGGGGNEN